MTPAIGDLMLEKIPLEAARPERKYGQSLSQLPWNFYMPITKPHQKFAKIWGPTLGISFKLRKFHGLAI